MLSVIFFFSSRRRHTIFDCDWSSDVCSSDLRTSERLEVAEMYAIPSTQSACAIDLDTSFVMSITERVGRAAAIEYGTSMLVMRVPPPSEAGNERPRGRP